MAHNPDHEPGTDWDCSDCALNCYCEYHGHTGEIYTEDDLDEACVHCQSEYNLAHADALEGLEW